MITVNGIACVESGCHVLGELEVYDGNTLKEWYEFFKNPWLED